MSCNGKMEQITVLAQKAGGYEGNLNASFNKIIAFYFLDP